MKRILIALLVMMTIFSLANAQKQNDYRERLYRKRKSDRNERERQGCQG